MPSAPQPSAPQPSAPQPSAPQPSAPRRPVLSHTVWAAAGAGVYLLLLALTIVSEFPHHPSLVLITLVMTIPLLVLGRMPLLALAMMLLAYVAWSLSWQSIAIAVFQILLIDVAVGVVAATRPRSHRFGAAIITAVVQVTSFAVFARTAALGVFVLAAVGALMTLVVAWSFGDSARQSREARTAMRAQYAAAAVAAERLRIARDLHDMVAHSIGIIAIQAGVGARVIGTQPDEARNALDTIEATSRQTLAALRRTVGALRRPEPDSAPLDPAPCLADLDRLVAATAHAGVRVNLRLVGERRELPAEIELSAYRIVQEALTNVVRHAGVHACQVTVEYADESVAVEIVDDGRGGDVGDSGYGIVGMRERVELLRGEFAAGPRLDGGFRVAARLPVPGPAPVVAVAKAP